MINGSLKSNINSSNNSNILPSVAVCSEAVEAMSEEEREKILANGAFKVKRIFDEADSTSRELLISHYNNKKLWPKMSDGKKVDGNTFIKVIYLIK